MMIPNEVILLIVSPFLIVAIWIALGYKKEKP